MSLVPYLPTPSRRLIIARMGWVLLLLVVLGVIIGGITPYFQQLVQTYNPIFADLGLAPSRYAAYVIGVDLLALLVHLLLAAVLYYRRPRDPMALLVAFTLITNGAVIPFSLLVRSTTLPLIVAWLIDLIIYLGLISSVTVLYLFPDGRFTPPWTRYLTIGWALLLLPTVLLADSRWDFGNWPFLLQWLLLLGWSGTGAWAQLIRYQHMADAGQKQQAKWAAFGLLAAVAAPFSYYLLFVVLPVLEETAVPNLLRQRLGLSFFSAPIYLHFIGITLLRVLTLLFPISFTIAILRHRLWEVDVWINRTVVYGGLTAVILTLYGLSVGLLSNLIPAQDGGLTVFLALIVVLLIMNPLRRQLQRGVDRLLPIPQQPAHDEETAPSIFPTTTPLLRLAHIIWVVILCYFIWVAFERLRLSRIIVGLGQDYLVQESLKLFPTATDSFIQYVLWLQIGVTAVFWFTALFIFWHKRHDWVALAAAYIFILTPFGFILSGSDDPTAAILSFAGLFISAAFPYIFPDGRFVPQSRRWRLALIFALFLTSILTYNIANVLYPTYHADELGYLSLMATFTFFTLAAISSQIYRYRHLSTPSQRQQTKWILIGFTAPALAFVWGLLWLFGLLEQIGLSEPGIALVMIHLTMMGTSVMPITFTFAIWRYGLWDVDVWINRTLVFGGLTLLVTAIYILTVGLMSTLFQSGNGLTLSVLATGLIAILFNPVRQRLQTAVNRLMYGERDDPITVLTALGRRLEETTVPAETLPALVETIAQTLKLPYVAIVGTGGQGGRGAEERGSVASLTGGEEILAVYPSPLAPHPSPFAFPLIYQTETIGQLLVSPRAPDETFNLAERRLLENVARQAGTAVHAAQLTHDLQRSRERLVTTREEERRRIRRDLHDGLGPQLATISLKVDAARNYLTQDVGTAGHLLTELKGEIQSAISDIRRLVHDLRPPALDQLGLVSALREYVAGHNGNGRLHISLTAPNTLPPLSAAVEVATYRIALEALTNVVRHAQAHSCQLCLEINDGLHLEIRDDGLGLPAGYQAGVGLSSMRERTAELGGMFHIESTPGGGTVVSVQLPFSSNQYPVDADADY